VIEFLLAGRQFLYQPENAGGTVYHVTKKGVEAIKSFSPLESPIVLFVDGDSGDSEPIISHPSVQIIVTSSPNGANHKWIKQAGRNTIIIKLATKLWSSRELFLTGLVLAFLLPTLG